MLVTTGLHRRSLEVVVDEIELLFEVPLPEEKILAGTPLRWKVGELELSSDLLTYHRWNLYCTLLSGIKLKEIHNNMQVPLSRFLELLDKSNDDRKKDDKIEQINATTKSFFSDSLKDFKDQYGVIPESLTELILSVSTLEDQSKAYIQLYNYYIVRGEQFPSETDFKVPYLQVKILSNYISRIAKVSDIIDLVEGIQKCNIEVKKKHERPPKQTETKKHHSVHNLINTFQKRIWAKRELMKSQSSQSSK